MAMSTEVGYLCCLERTIDNNNGTLLDYSDSRSTFRPCHLLIKITFDANDAQSSIFTQQEIHMRAMNGVNFYGKLALLWPVGQFKGNNKN